MLRLFAVIGLAAVALLVGGWLFMSRPGRFLSVGGEQLGSSLARQHDGNGGATCSRKAGATLYKCDLELDPGSGFAETYRLTASTDGCWHAQMRKSRLQGCVDLLDYVWPAKPFDPATLDSH